MAKAVKYAGNPKRENQLMSEKHPTPEYEAPSVSVVGNLHEDTLRNKAFGTPTDGDFFNHRGLTTVS